MRRTSSCSRSMAKSSRPGEIVMRGKRSWVHDTGSCTPRNVKVSARPGTGGASLRPVSSSSRIFFCSQPTCSRRNARTVAGCVPAGADTRGPPAPTVSDMRKARGLVCARTRMVRPFGASNSTMSDDCGMPTPGVGVATSHRMRARHAERGFDRVKQTRHLAAHQDEACIKFRPGRIAIALVELFGRDIEQFELAHRERVIEYEAHPFLERQREL